VAAVLDKQSIVASTPGYEQRELIGAAFTSIEALSADHFRNIQDRAIFRAPASKVTRPKVIGWSVAKPNRTLGAGATASNTNTGVAKVFLDSTAYSELRIQGQSQHLITAPTGWHDLTGDAYPANGVGSFMGGLTITSAQTVSIRVTPLSATQTAWNCTIWGTLAGALVTNKARFLSYATTADQVALTYSPPSDFKLLGYNITGGVIGHVSGWHITEFAGLQSLDMGYMGMDDTTTVPMGPNITFGAGAVWINTWGMKFYPGDSIGFRIAKNSADSSEWHQFVMGDDTVLTEGVGAAIYPAVGDVDLSVTYGPTGADYTGTLEQPAVGDVRNGTQYGAGGTEFTGTYVGSGGGNGLHMDVDTGNLYKEISTLLILKL